MLILLSLCASLIREEYLVVFYGPCSFVKNVLWYPIVKIVERVPMSLAPWSIVMLAGLPASEDPTRSTCVMLESFCESLVLSASLSHFVVHCAIGLVHFGIPGAWWNSRSHQNPKWSKDGNPK